MRSRANAHVVLPKEWSSTMRTHGIIEISLNTEHNPVIMRIVQTGYGLDCGVFLQWGEDLINCPPDVWCPPNVWEEGRSTDISGQFVNISPSCEDLTKIIESIPLEDVDEFFQEFIRFMQEDVSNEPF